MNVDQFIHIPATTPIVTNPNNKVELFFKGFYSANTRFYVVKHVEGHLIHVESRQYDYHLKGLAKVIFVATMIGPLFCLLVVGFTISQRKAYRFKASVENQRLPVVPVSRIVVEKPREPDFLPVVKQSIEKSGSSQIPLAPKLYLKNSVKALQIYLEADPTLENYRKIEALTLEKELILSLILDSLKVPGPRKNEVRVLLDKEFEQEFALLKSPHMQIKLCRGIINSIGPGGNWVAKMDKAFCEVIEMLPNHLDEMKKEQEFLDLKEAVENLARTAEQRVLNNLELTQFRDVYNSVAIRLGLPEMELKNFTENDATLARELQESL